MTPDAKKIHAPDHISGINKALPQMLDSLDDPAREALIKNLPNLIKKKKLDFVIVNGENAADSGVGITKKNTEESRNYYQ